LNRLLILTLALYVLFVLCAVFARADPGGVQIAPVLIEIAPERRTASFRVRNTTENEQAFEITAFDWRQDNGADQLHDSPDLIVTPNLFALAPGATQIVRLALAPAAHSPQSERAFRLHLKQLPNPDAPASAGLRLRLEFSLPVFAQARGASPLLIAQTAESGAIDLVNVGAAHARLAGVRVGGREIAGAPRYLLAGARFSAPAPDAPTLLVETRSRAEGAWRRLDLAEPAADPRAP